MVNGLNGTDVQFDVMVTGNIFGDILSDEVFLVSYRKNAILVGVVSLLAAAFARSLSTVCARACA